MNRLPAAAAALRPMTSDPITGLLDHSLVGLDYSRQGVMGRDGVRVRVRYSRQKVRVRYSLQQPILFYSTT